MNPRAGWGTDPDEDRVITWLEFLHGEPMNPETTKHFKIDINGKLMESAPEASKLAPVIGMRNALFFVVAFCWVPLLLLIAWLVNR